MEAYAKKKKIIINANVKMDIWATIAKVIEIMTTFTLMRYPLLLPVIQKYLLMILSFVDIYM